MLLISARASEDIERIKATLEADLKAALVPGAGIVLIHQGRTVAWGVGVADADARTSVDARTLMPIGSITKLVTALAVMVSLAPSDLDAGVARVWPGLPAPVGSLTFHQLLSHSSGLRDQPGDDGSRDESALRLGASQLNADDVLLSPGRVFSYSNLGYALAGASLEQFRAASVRGRGPRHSSSPSRHEPVDVSIGRRGSGIDRRGASIVCRAHQQTGAVGHRHATVAGRLLAE